MNPILGTVLFIIFLIYTFFSSFVFDQVPGDGFKKTTIAVVVIVLQFILLGFVFSQSFPWLFVILGIFTVLSVVSLLIKLTIHIFKHLSK